jgi:alkylation response protein AidB-like acyl-CoA dehydrogenase
MAVDLAACTDAELQAYAFDWLAAELPAGWMAAVDAGDRTTIARLRAELDSADWCTRIGEAGLATPTWPAAYGAGLSLAPGKARVVAEVCNRYKVSRPFNIIGIGMGGPTLLAWGSEDLKHRFLRGIATNEEIWCQLFSEPGSGSDLAGLSTRATRDGDEWVLTGQKVWTSLAHLSSYGMVLARTDPDVAKHAGLTYFVVDMHAPGVEVRPLRQLTGESEFNEVFLDGVRVPDAWRLGPEGEGWRVAVTTLMNERVAMSGAGSVLGDVASGSPVTRLIERHQPVVDPQRRQRLARAYVDERVIALNNKRAADRRRHGLDAGLDAGPEGSITKLQSAEANQRLHQLALDLEGASGIAWEGRPLVHDVGTVFAVGDETSRGAARAFLRARANTIEGGTSEIMRNILGERVLGLPKEPDPFRGAPWRDVPRND